MTEGTTHAANSLRRSCRESCAARRTSSRAIRARDACSPRLKGASLSTLVPMKAMAPSWVEVHLDSSTLRPALASALLASLFTVSTWTDGGEATIRSSA